MITINLIGKNQNFTASAKPTEVKMRVVRVSIPLIGSPIFGLGSPLICMSASKPPHDFQAELNKAQEKLLGKLDNRSRQVKKEAKKACEMMENYMGFTPEGDFVFQKYKQATGLAELGLSHKMIIAALVSELPVESLENIFDNRIIDVVTQVKRIHSFHYTDINYEKKEAFMNFLISEFSINAILIVAMDELVTLQTTVEGKTPEEIKEAKEIRSELAIRAFDITARILRRLKYKELAEKLEDAALHYLSPDKFEAFQAKIHNKLKKDRFRAFAELNIIADALAKYLASREVELLYPSPFVHIKSVSHTIEKSERKGDIDLERTYDIERMRLLVPTERDCYAAADQTALYFEKNGWTEIKERRRDYIKHPKDETLYKSLHLTFMNKTDQTKIEVQIRTREMDIQAEFDGYKDRNILSSDSYIPPNPNQIYKMWGDSIKGIVYAFDEKGEIYELIPFPKDKRPAVLDFAVAKSLPLRSNSLKAYVKESGSWVEIDPLGDVQNGRRYIFFTSVEAVDKEWVSNALKRAATLKAQLELRGNPHEFRKRGEALIDDIISGLESRTQSDVVEIMGDLETIEHITYISINGIAQSMGLSSSRELYEALGIFEKTMPDLLAEVAENISRSIFLRSEVEQKDNKAFLWLILPDNPEIFLRIVKLLRNSSANPENIRLQSLKSGDFLLRIESDADHIRNHHRFTEQLSDLVGTIKFYIQEYLDEKIEIKIKSADAESNLSVLEILANMGAKISKIKTPRHADHNLLVAYQIPKGRNLRNFASKARQNIKEVKGVDLI